MGKIPHKKEDFGVGNAHHPPHGKNGQKKKTPSQKRKKAPIAQGSHRDAVTKKAPSGRELAAAGRLRESAEENSQIYPPTPALSLRLALRAIHLPPGGRLGCAVIASCYRPMRNRGRSLKRYSRIRRESAISYSTKAPFPRANTTTDRVIPVSGRAST